tara:strand:- start:407 stop:1204 length:798 start_codon:yes stop_codon:yes gene_type:complete
MPMIDTAKQACKISIHAFCSNSVNFHEFGLDSVKSYEWPKKGPNLDELISVYDPKFQLSGDSNYEKNVSLKLLLSKKFNENNLDVNSISKWIIMSWGGIKVLSRKIDDYIYHVETKSYPDYLNGVASYSKLFAMFYPREFAIYDARVAVSLNIIQLLSDEKNALFFPYLSGRNKVTGDQTSGRGFSNIYDFKKNQIEATSQKHWEFIKQKDVYKIYNEILNDLCEENKWDLWDVEMLLFAKAEELVLKINKSAQYRNVDWSPLKN